MSVCIYKYIILNWLFLFVFFFFFSSISVMVSFSYFFIVRNNFQTIQTKKILILEHSWFLLLNIRVYIFFPAKKKWNKKQRRRKNSPLKNWFSCKENLWILRKKKKRKKEEFWNNSFLKHLLNKKKEKSLKICSIKMFQQRKIIKY